MQNKTFRPMTLANDLALLALVAVGCIYWFGYPRRLPKDENKNVTVSITRYHPDGSLHSKYEHTGSAAYWRYQLGTNINYRWFAPLFDVKDEDGRWVGRMKR